MKPTHEPVHVLTLKEMSADTGRTQGVGECHVYTSEDLIFTEKMFKPVRPEHFTILLITGGEAQIKINLLEYSLLKNSLIIIPPKTVNELTYKSEDCTLIILCFTPDFLGSNFQDKKQADYFSFLAAQNNPYFQLQDKEADTLFPMLLLLRQQSDTLQKHDFKKEMVYHSFMLFMFELALVMKKQREHMFIKFTRKEELLMRFIKLLSIHIRMQRSVGFYANALYITPKHLSKIVKEMTGKTSGEMIDEMVITEAKILLNDLSVSIGNVADHLHFSDQFFFSKFFKQHTGLTPTEYKSSL